MLAFDDGWDALVLFSLKHELPIWKYNFDSTRFWGQVSNAARNRGVVDDHLVYAATFDEAVAVAWQSERAVAQWQSISGHGNSQTEDFLIIKRGAKFRVEVKCD